MPAALPGRDYRLRLAIIVVIVLTVLVSDSLKQRVSFCDIANRNQGNFHIEPVLQRTDHLVRQNRVTGIRRMDAIQRKEAAAECGGDALISNLESMGGHVGEQTVEVKDTCSKLTGVGGD